MNFKRADTEKMIGTSLVGYVTANYADLVRVFGEPMENDGYKTDAEWVVEFDDGTIATIYNYKDGHNYCGDEGMDVENITDWHVGGRAELAAYRVKEALSDANVA